jgi:tetratricopeptide (TPR) repeat protein
MKYGVKKSMNGLQRKLQNTLLYSLAALALTIPITLIPATAANQDELLFKQAQQLTNQKHIAEAQKILVKLCNSPNASVQALCLLTWTYLAEESTITDEHIDECEKLTKRAIKRDPEWGNAYKLQAQIYNLHDKHEQAIAYSTKALSVKNPDPKAYLQRCLAYEAMGKHKEALSDITIYSDKYAPEAEMLELKGSVLVNLNRYDDAIATYRVALKKQFKDWTIYRIVDCFEQLHQYDKAVEELTRLIKINAVDSEAYQTRGRMLGLAKHYKEAIDDYTKAIKLEPTARFYKERAALYKLTGKPKEAAEDLKKAIIEDKAHY